ncbi:MAG: phosphoribosylanthranilate isomerase [Acidimicrobiales bacterium]
MRLTTEGLFIKISGVTNEQDALFAIGLGASAVGFDFALTSRQITVDSAHEIIRRLPHGALSVGVFRNELPQRIVEIANTIGLSAVQIDGSISDSDLAYVGERVNTVLRTPPEGRERFPLAGGADYLLVPERDDAQALAGVLDLFAASDRRSPVIASGGMDITNVVDVVQNFPVYGVDVRSGVESSPGVKDPGLLGQFIANARWAYDNAYVARHFDEWTL